jgi:sarcosine oxidase subunit gamma
VAELAASGAHPGLPLEVGAARLAALPQAPLWSVMPFRGREREVAAVLGAELAVGRAAAAAGGRLVWAGLGMWLLSGPADVAALVGLAAVTAQEDGWCGLGLGGADAPAVLARLVPVDLDPAAFPPGAAARSLLRHVPLLIVRIEAGFELFVPRSCDRTAVHEIAAAMRAVAARAEASDGLDRVRDCD